MKSKLVLAFVTLGLFISTGCYRAVYTGENLAHIATLNSPDPGEVTVEHFQVKQWNHHFLGGLVHTSKIDLSDVIKDKLKPGYAVRNLSIRHQLTFGNMVVTWLALGGIIYSPLSTVIEGDIVEVGSRKQPTVPAAVRKT